jgi:hypothetical protein
LRKYFQQAIEPLLKAEAKERQAIAGKLKSEAAAKLAQAKGRARDKVAKRTGKDGKMAARASPVLDLKSPRSFGPGLPRSTFASARPSFHRAAIRSSLIGRMSSTL